MRRYPQFRSSPEFASPLSEVAVAGADVTLSGGGMAIAWTIPAQTITVSGTSLSASVLTASWTILQQLITGGVAVNHNHRQPRLPNVPNIPTIRRF